MIMCDADASGDGLVPLDSAILLNLIRFVLDNRAHASLCRYCYGSPAYIEKMVASGRTSELTIAK